MIKCGPDGTWSHALEALSPQVEELRIGTKPLYRLFTVNNRTFDSYFTLADWRAAGRTLSVITRPVRTRADRPQPASRGSPLRSRRDSGPFEAPESIPRPGDGIALLDGNQDQAEVRKGLKPSDASVSVRERIAALEAKRTPDADDPTASPIVYPLHYRRFLRRTSGGTPIKPETPIIHAPQPTRSITAASFLLGTRSHCHRHGRYHPSPDVTAPAHVAGGKHMAKSRSGAYIPTGYIKRQQMEATSPWVARRLTIPTDAEACSDCTQELSIKRRELCHRPEPSSEARNPMTPSVSELLDMIDHAANEISQNCRRIAQHLQTVPDVNNAAQIPSATTPAAQSLPAPLRSDYSLLTPNPPMSTVLPPADIHAVSTPSTAPPAPVPPNRDDSPEATTPQPISSLSNPYHHAPRIPLDAREHQRVIRAAEREARRQSLARKGQGGASIAMKGR